MASSITSRHDARGAVAGTKLIYAPTHQFGADKGAFGQTFRGAPIPWGDIPARPFLGLSDDDRDEVLKTIERPLSDDPKR